uniref:Uncharacterized protein n=1 Tax=Anguilla anguilla TaxID=7936 RepID=A0A0E9XCW6_ANGAN
MLKILIFMEYCAGPPIESKKIYISSYLSLQFMHNCFLLSHL